MKTLTELHRSEAKTSWSPSGGGLQYRRQNPALLLWVEWGPNFKNSNTKKFQYKKDDFVSKSWERLQPVNYGQFEWSRSKVVNIDFCVYRYVFESFSCGIKSAIYYHVVLYFQCSFCVFILKWTYFVPSFLLLVCLFKKKTVTCILCDEINWKHEFPGSKYSAFVSIRCTCLCIWSFCFTWNKYMEWWVAFITIYCTWFWLWAFFFLLVY